MGHGNCFMPTTVLSSRAFGVAKGSKGPGLPRADKAFTESMERRLHDGKRFQFFCPGFLYMCNKCVITWGKGVAYLTMSGVLDDTQWGGSEAESLDEMKLREWRDVRDEEEKKQGQNETSTNTFRHFSIILAHCMFAPVDLHSLIYTMRGAVCISGALLLPY